jgi:hypothetical protein
MNPLKKLQEVLVLGLVWLPVAAISLFLVDRMEDISGEDWTVYGIVAALVAIAFVATEYILEAVKVDTTYTSE